MLKELIYQHFENERQQKEKRAKEIEKPYNIAPSYLTDCIRKIYYKKTNADVTNPVSLHTYIKWEMGHSVHETIYQILTQVAYIKKGEVWLEKDKFNFKWIYRVDDYIMVNAQNHIIEIKSTYGNSAYNDLPKESAVMQLFCYMLLEEIDRGILLYICRDTGYIEEFHFHIDGLKERYGDKYHERLMKLQECNGCIVRQQLPDREYQIVLKKKDGVLTDSFQKDNVKYKSDWQCGYCLYRNLCWNDILSTIQNDQFYIKGEII
jgi:hypothetical protein